MAKEKTIKVVNKGGPAAGIYIMGMFGAAVYFISNTDGFGNVVVALLKSLVWPAFLINRIFELLRI